MRNSCDSEGSMLAMGQKENLVMFELSWRRPVKGSYVNQLMKGMMIAGPRARAGRLRLNISCLILYVTAAVTAAVTVTVAIAVAVAVAVAAAVAVAVAVAGLREL